MKAGLAFANWLHRLRQSLRLRGSLESSIAATAAANRDPTGSSAAYSAFVAGPMSAVTLLHIVRLRPPIFIWLAVSWMFAGAVAVLSKHDPQPCAGYVQNHSDFIGMVYRMLLRTAQYGFVPYSGAFNNAVRSGETTESRRIPESNRALSRIELLWRKIIRKAAFW